MTTSFETGPNGPIVKELPETLPEAPVIRRPGQINAMDNEEFADLVKKSGKKQVIVRYAFPEVIYSEFFVYMNDVVAF